MVIAISKEGQSRKLIYDRTLVLLDKRDTLSFIIRHENDIQKWTVQAHLRFIFDDLGEEFSSTIHMFHDTAVGVGQEWRLHRWYSPTYVEVSAPEILQVQDSAGAVRTLLVKFRTQSTEGLNHRTFSISVWLAE